MKGRPWTPERRAQFAKDWNDGLGTEDLRAKYAVRLPGVVAYRLRQRGLKLTLRQGVVLLLLVIVGGCATKTTYQHGRVSVTTQDAARAPVVGEK